MKPNKSKRKTFNSITLGIGLITGFIFIVAFSSIYVSNAIKNNAACGCVVPIPYMILILSSLGIFVGSTSYYFIATKYVKEKTENTKVFLDKAECTLRFLEPDEKKIITCLIEHKKGLRQTDIEKKTGIHKVQIHRIVNRLVSKKVVKKININGVIQIRLSQDLSELFLRDQ